MGQIVDFKNVSAAGGLESSPVARSLAGLRANESRYFWNKYRHDFVVTPADENKNQNWQGQSAVHTLSLKGNIRSSDSEN